MNSTVAQRAEPSGQRDVIVNCAGTGCPAASNNAMSFSDAKTPCANGTPETTGHDSRGTPVGSWMVSGTSIDLLFASRGRAPAINAIISLSIISVPPRRTGALTTAVYFAPSVNGGRTTAWLRILSSSSFTVCNGCPSRPNSTVAAANAVDEIHDSCVRPSGNVNAFNS